MIIVRLKAGMGNQLFQYATGKKLAIHHNSCLKLDISSFKLDGFRQYSLSPFKIEENFATDDDIANVRGVPSRPIARVCYRLFEAIKPRHQRHVFDEYALGVYDPSILKTPSSVYLNGYWQSEKYFSDIRNLLQEEYSLKNPPDESNRKMLELISGSESVGIHIRRADYVSHPDTAKRYLTCEAEYYERAIDTLTKSVSGDFCFFVFSDDMDWAKSYLKLAYPAIYVTHNRARDYDDFRLMRACKHNIIANSSFSWWAAWLNNNPNKLVVAPKKYFKDPKVKMSDWYAEKWVCV